MGKAVPQSHGSEPEIKVGRVVTECYGCVGSTPPGRRARIKNKERSQ